MMRAMTLSYMTFLVTCVAMVPFHGHRHGNRFANPKKTSSPIKLCLLVIAALFMAQSVDWVETCGLPGREKTENDAHRSGKEKGDDHNAGVEDKGNIQ
jgi:hypothetical protein